MFHAAESFWEYWLLNHKIRVDPINKHLIVGTDVTELNIKSDVYSDYKEWFNLNTNAGLGDVAIRTIGGDPTVDSEFAGDIYFLQNGWRLIVDPRQTAITGALFSDDYETAYAVPETFEPFFPVKVASIVTQIQADLGDLNIPSAIQIAAAVKEALSTDFDEIPAEVWTDSSALTLPLFLATKDLKV